MNALTQKAGDYPDDVLDEARDLLKTVRLALVSEWFDPEECLSLAVVVGQALKRLDRVYAVLGEGAGSTFDPKTPKGKWLIPEFAPKDVQS